MIDHSTVQQILDAADIVDVVSDFVSLKRRGANWIGLCPFHNDRRPSFYVSRAKGICKCFACGEGGSAVNFIMKHEQLSYPEALRYLARCRYRNRTHTLVYPVEKFCKVITYSKYLRDNRKFKSSVRFIQSLTHYKVRRYEAWLSLGIDIIDISETVDKCMRNSSGYYNYRYTTDKHVYWEPSRFPKSTLRYIRKNFKELTSDAISKMYHLTNDGYDINLIGELLERTESTPQYREFFRVKEYSWRDDSEKFNIFDLSQNRNFSTLGMMQTIIECISEYNLNVDAFLKFCLRMYNVEGLTISDLFITSHYKDYLNMERKLKNHQMRKMDKYPQHFLTIFHITKKEYAIRKQEFDEEDFKMQCDKFRDLEQKFKMKVSHMFMYMLKMIRK